MALHTIKVAAKDFPSENETQGCQNYNMLDDLQFRIASGRSRLAAPPAGKVCGMGWSGLSTILENKRNIEHFQIR